MRYFYVFFAFFLYASISSGQDNFPMKKNVVSISGSLDGELKFFYERILYKRHALELGAGKKWSDTSDTDINAPRNFLASDHPSRFYEGYLFSAGYKFYIEDKLHPWYVSVNAIYKMYTYPTISLTSGGDVFIQKGSKDVIAGKLLFGKRFNFLVGSKLNLIMDLNFGIGIRERRFIDVIYYSYDGQNAVYNDPPEIESEKKIIPSFEIGAKFGMGF